MDGWMDGWVEAKAGLRIAYSNQKLNLKNTVGLKHYFDVGYHDVWNVFETYFKLALFKKVKNNQTSFGLAPNFSGPVTGTRLGGCETLF